MSRAAKWASCESPVSAATEFDFGAEVEGFLQLSYDRGPERTALVRAAADSAQASGWLPDAIVISVNGSRVWRDAVPRRFRYVEVVGLKGLRWAGFYPLRRSQEANLSRALTPRGLFNLRVDPQRWPAVDEIWKTYLDLPRAASVALPASGLKRAGGARIPERLRERAGRHNPEKH